MAKTQVFRAHKGQMETLQKGFLDLRALGPITVRRSSEIEFDDDAQMHYIHFLEPTLQHLNPDVRNLFFPTYELAVEEEIRIINRERLKGTV